MGALEDELGPDGGCGADGMMLITWDDPVANVPAAANAYRRNR
jgi:hypothetical protein